MTPKQEAFVQEYLIDFNATQAAVRAGYSSKTAYSIGQRLLKNVEVQEYLEILLAGLESKKIADAEEVLQTLTRILRREESEYIVVTAKRRCSRYDEKGKKVIEEHEEPLTVPIRPKLTDVNKAAELLGRRYGLWVDKLQAELAVTPQIIDDIGNDDDGS